MITKEQIDQYFPNEKINANLSTAIDALAELTLVEFRMWIEFCKTYENTHWTHFRGKEEQYIKTGSWELPDVELGHLEEDIDE